MPALSSLVSWEMIVGHAAAISLRDISVARAFGLSEANPDFSAFQNKDQEHTEHAQSMEVKAQARRPCLLKKNAHTHTHILQSFAHAHKHSHTLTRGNRVCVCPQSMDRFTNL